MPATILSLSHQDGDQVEEGEPVLVMESMKMEMKLYAHKAGTVHYYVQKGEVVKEGTTLLEIK